MPDGLSELYHELLSGSYDCVDRIVLNAYFGMGHTHWSAQRLPRPHFCLRDASREAVHGHRRAA